VKGLSELALAAAVLVAAWTRTPAGALVQGAAALVQDRQGPDLLEAFHAGLPDRIDQTIAAAAAQPPTPGAGLETALTAALGAEAATALTAEVARGRDLEAVLELRAVGVAARTRAIRRAQAAGAPEPRRYAAHRRFLPDALRRKADREVSEVLALVTVLDLRWPVSADARVTSPFGVRVHPVLGTRKAHEGIDIAVPTGTPVHAAGHGRVLRAREGRVSGRYVVIDHGHGVTSNYCHAETLHVAKGEPVARGAHILDSGNTGRSTGPHLHFGLRIHGRAVDPAPFRTAAERDDS
jgi:murein DD-endopeptidase MepM/ murein hydrolase activator NlpD